MQIFFAKIGHRIIDSFSTVANSQQTAVRLWITLSTTIHNLPAAGSDTGGPQGFGRRR